MASRPPVQRRHRTPEYARTWNPRRSMEVRRARLVGRDAGSDRRRGDRRSIEAVGGLAGDAFLIGGHRGHGRQCRGLNFRNAGRQGAQANEPAALTAGTRAFRVVVDRAVVVNMRTAGVLMSTVPMSIVLMNRLEAVILIREAMGGARAVTEGKGGGR